MNHSITGICSSVTALGLSLSSMKTVVRASSACDSIHRSRNLNLPWLRNEGTLSMHKRMGELYIFSRHVLHQVCWFCRISLRLHCSTGEHYTIQIFRKLTICSQWYDNICIDSSHNALFYTTSHTLDHVANQLLISFFCCNDTYRFI